MWDIRFWTLFALVVITTGVILAIKKVRFIDVQLMLMISALALACDMLFCKQFDLYHYISNDYQGWYSFWANLFIVPAWGLLFIKFAPKSNIGIAFYTVVWAAASTFFELYIVKPIGIILYHGWSIIPHSAIGFLLVLTWTYVYYRLMLRYCSIKRENDNDPQP